MSLVSGLSVTPRWVAWLRIFVVLIGLPSLVLSSYVAHQEGRKEAAELIATTLVVLACSHLLLRAPLRRLTFWEAPVVAVSVALACVGGFLFCPSEQERQWGFQVFLGVFAGLATAYGFFCTTVPPDHPLRSSVIEPTKRVSKLGLLGCDIGLVAAPFAFVTFLFRHAYRARKTVSGRGSRGGKGPQPTR